MFASKKASSHYGATRDWLQRSAAFALANGSRSVELAGKLKRMNCRMDARTEELPMWRTPRREFLKLGTASLLTAALGPQAGPGRAQDSGERPEAADGVTVLNPRRKVPLSFIIDDSTCLVNLNRFAIPQFATAWGQTGGGFAQPWRSWPHEIPDSFVRRFGEWSAQQGVKGKYSVVPFPACVGRIDRVLPGWSRQEVDDSIRLVRDLMMPNWDIHPEMVTHTWVIDTKTGHPYPERTLRYQENWNWTDNRSVDELANYMSYGLQILKNVGLSCSGITTPGGFGMRVLPELAQATLESCRDVFATPIPHYFRHILSQGADSVAPRVEYASDLRGADPRCVVSIVGCTGDWTGGWDCSSPPEPDRFITPDLASGRMVEVIERGEPACMVCHWTGIYFNGEELGFKAFQEVVRRLHSRYDHLLWMTLSELAQYWAAKELTRIEPAGDRLTLHAPYVCPQFTLHVGKRPAAPPRLTAGNESIEMREVARAADLVTNTWWIDDRGATICFDLPRGQSSLSL
jgi:hypothetical protein